MLKVPAKLHQLLTLLVRPADVLADRSARALDRGSYLACHSGIDSGYHYRWRTARKPSLSKPSKLTDLSLSILGRLLKLMNSASECGSKCVRLAGSGGIGTDERRELYRDFNVSNLC